MGNNFFFNLTAADPNTHGGLLRQANAFQTTFQTSLLLLPFSESNFFSWPHKTLTWPVALRRGNRGEWPMYWVLKLQANFHHYRGAGISQNCRSLLKILGARRVTWCQFHTEDPPILGVTVQSLVATATWRPGFVNKMRHSQSGDDVCSSFPRCSAISTS